MAGPGIANAAGALGMMGGLEDLLAQRIMAQKVQAMQAQDAEDQRREVSDRAAKADNLAAQTGKLRAETTDIGQKRITAFNAKPGEDAEAARRFDTTEGRLTGDARTKAEHDRAKLDADIESDAANRSTQLKVAGMYAARNKGAGAGNGGGTVKITYQDPETGGVVEEYVTKEEARARGKMIAPPKGGGLSAAAKDEIATMATVQDLAREVLTMGEDKGWSGVGGMGKGTASGFMARNFGRGTTEAEQLRNHIGNMQGTIAKLRGGTSFTPNEQKLLDSYTPGINDDPMVIKAKIGSLNQFIESKRKNTLAAAQAGTAGGGVMASHTTDVGGQDGGVSEYDWVDGKLVPRKK